MIYITDIFKDVCKRIEDCLDIKVNYQFGEWKQIASVMEILSKSSYTEAVKYPLIALFTPFVEDKSTTDCYCKTSVDLLIATRTRSEYTNEERIEISFKGLLHPVYLTLIDELKKEKRFDFGFQNIVEHDFSDNLRYGSRGVYGSDDKNPFTDLFDGVDIKNLNLRVRPEVKCKLKQI